MKSILPFLLPILFVLLDVSFGLSVVRSRVGSLMWTAVISFWYFKHNEQKLWLVIPMAFILFPLVNTSQSSEEVSVA